MGKLTAVWTNLPDSENEGLFKEEFYRFFGIRWDEVMLGAENPFDYHLYWDGYFAITEIEKIQGRTVLDLPIMDTVSGKKLSHNVIIG